MKKDKQPPEEPKADETATFHQGNTTQGGSNFGQGAAGLGKKSKDQGDEAGKGSNYENEQGWNNEALRQEDID